MGPDLIRSETTADLDDRSFGHRDPLLVDTSTVYFGPVTVM